MATKRAPPGPKGHWLTGHLSSFRSDRLGFLTRCAREYGDFVSVRIGHKRAVHISDPAAIEYVFVGGSKYFRKHFALRMAPLLLGKGLLTSEGDFWLRQRRLAQPAFHKNRIASYGPIVVEHTERLLAGWKEGERRDILAEMMRLTLSIIAKTLFDAEIEGKARDVGKALRVLHNQFLLRFNSLVPVPLYLPTPVNLRHRRMVRRLNEIIYGFIRQRRASGQDRGDFLSMLLHARDEYDLTGMSDRQVRDEAMTIFLAGHETTALTLTWAWYLLSQTRPAQERLAQEVDTALGGRLPTVADLPCLPYAEQVILETMRLYPPAYTIGREAISNVEIGGYHIAAGTTLLLSPWVMHRDPRFFDAPEEFQPARWQNDLARRLPRVVYFPFGAGPRICIGNAFAMMETVLALATIAQRYHFTLAEGATVVPWPTFTLRPKPGVPAILTPRKV